MNQYFAPVIAIPTANNDGPMPQYKAEKAVAGKSSTRLRVPRTVGLKIAQATSEITVAVMARKYRNQMFSEIRADRDVSFNIVLPKCNRRSGNGWNGAQCQTPSKIIYPEPPRLHYH